MSWLGNTTSSYWVVDETPVDRSAVEELETVSETVHIFSYPNHRFYLNALVGIVSRKPLQTHYYQFGTASEWLNDNRGRFDLLYCNHVRTTEYVRGYDRAKVVDLVDVISRNYRAASESTIGLWRLIYPVEWCRLRRYERQVAREFDHAFIFTESDGQFVTGGESWELLSLLPNGMKPELLERKPTGCRTDPADPRIVFLGKMDYFPNIEAAVHFATDVFPEIRANYPTARFLVVGANPNERVRTLDDRPGVSVAGFVDDPREYLDRADVVRCVTVPGFRTRSSKRWHSVVQSLHLRSLSEGIAIEDGRHLVVAEEDEMFATAVCGLIADVGRRHAVGRAARRLIERAYSWERIGTELRDEVATALQ